MGPSGSGKTTFLNIAGLLDTFDRGRYLLDGVDVAGLNDDQQSRLRNERIGFIFQSFNLIPDLDVYDNVEVPLRYRRLPAAERRDRVEEVLVQMGLTARMRHLPSQLSGGQQQRVAIARALVGRPQLLLADEPTGNLDTIASRQVLDLLEKINAERQTTIVMVTHDPALAARARRKLHVLDGRLIDPHAAGGPAALPHAAARQAGGVVTNLFYNLRLVAKSLRRDRWFTLVMVLSQALSVSIFVTALVSAQRYSNVTGQVRSDVFRVEGDRNGALARFYRGTQFEGFGEFTANYVSLPTVRALAATGLATGSTVNFVSVMTGGPVERPPGAAARPLLRRRHVPPVQHRLPLRRAVHRAPTSAPRRRRRRSCCPTC